MVTYTIAAAAAGPVDEALDAVVLIRQGSATCAGAHLGGGVVATAYHCVASGGHPAVTTRLGARRIGRVRAVSPVDDLAVIDVPGLDVAALTLADEVPAIGAAVWALGHPLGEDPPAGLLAGTLRWSASDGTVAAIGDWTLQITAALNPGNSGGPVIDADQRLVGIVSRRLAGAGLGFAVRADRLAALLAEPPGWSVIGGTWGGRRVVSAPTGGDALFAVGGELELAVRDHLVVDARAAIPLSPRWTAARFGSASASVAELRGGLRQRFGRGTWAVRLDVTGGVAAVTSWSRPDDDPLGLSSVTAAAPVGAVTLAVRSGGLELGWLPGPDGGTSRAAVIVRWPGVIGVF